MELASDECVLHKEIQNSSLAHAFDFACNLTRPYLLLRHLASNNAAKQLLSKIDLFLYRFIGRVGFDKIAAQPVHQCVWWTYLVPSS